MLVKSSKASLPNPPLTLAKPPAVSATVARTEQTEREVVKRAEVRKIPVGLR
jgi:hypothetical protein